MFCRMMQMSYAFVLLIHKLKVVDRKRCYTCWSWMKTYVPLSTTWNGTRRGGNDTTHTCHE